MSKTIFYKINPIAQKLDELINFTEVHSDNPLINQEYPYFKETVKELITQVKKKKALLDTYFKHREDLLYQMEDSADDGEGTVSERGLIMSEYEELIDKMNEMAIEVNRLLHAVDSPYFGKITLSNGITSYIGKSSLFDKHGIAKIIDWRSPVANIFYKQVGPSKNLTIKLPHKTITTDLTEKLSFLTSDARINDIYEAKSGNVSADEFLLSNLNLKTSSKLEDIIATIQGEQNDIIRYKENTPMIIQGVAGSGKTTIILHRLSYLSFLKESPITSSNSLIIVPNPFFIDYVSDILPTLGISDSVVKTFSSWVIEELNIKEQVKIDFSISKEQALEKGRLDYKKIIEEKLEKYISNELLNVPNVEKKIVRKYFTWLREKNPNLPIIQILKQSVEYTLDERKKELIEKKVDEIEEYIKVSTSPLTIFAYLFNITSTDTTTISYTDIAPLLWIYLTIHGADDISKSYVIVDEAQDLSPFQILCLKSIAKKNNILLAGDVAQAIKEPNYFENWKEIEKILGENTEMFYINKCYRTTYEIAIYAKEILKKGYTDKNILPEPIERHGDDVKEVNMNNYSDIAKLINDGMDKRYGTCAVVCKDRKIANEVHKGLSKETLNNTLHNIDIVDYRNGIFVLPVQKVKGLEFDYVIIIDWGNGTEELMDVKLRYVASTRAMHKLVVVKKK